MQITRAHHTALNRPPRTATRNRVTTRISQQA